MTRATLHTLADVLGRPELRDPSLTTDRARTRAFAGALRGLGREGLTSVLLAIETERERRGRQISR